jgi:hypothetical protein
LPLVPGPERLYFWRVDPRRNFPTSLEEEETSLEEEEMPVIILWAVPAIVVVGGGIYLISHMH